MLKTRKIVSLFIVLLVTSGLTSLGLFVKLIDFYPAKLLINCLLYVIVTLPSMIAYKKAGKKLRIIFMDRSVQQYVFGIIIALLLSFIIALVSVMLGNSLIGNKIEPNMVVMVSNAIFYIAFVGPSEEFIFRVYVQETLSELIPKLKVLSPLFSALIFGLWHGLSGNLSQIIFTFAIGLVFGYSKYCFKKCTFVSVALGHGLYDFINIIIRMYFI